MRLSILVYFLVYTVDVVDKAGFDILDSSNLLFYLKKEVLYIPKFSKLI